MAYIENTISLKKKKKTEGEECVYSIILQLMPFTYSRNWAATHEKKRRRKKAAAEWPVKIAGAAAAVPNNQIRPYFPGPQLQYRPRPPLNSKKARLARSVLQKAKKGGKTPQPRERGRRGGSGGTSLRKKRSKKVEGAHTRHTSPDLFSLTSLNHRTLPPCADG